MWGLGMDWVEWVAWIRMNGKNGWWRIGESVGHKIGSKINRLTQAANPDSALSCFFLSCSDENIFVDQSAQLTSMGVQFEES
jgi:hypothetical protein